MSSAQMLGATEAALALIEKMIELREPYQSLNAALKEVQGDFASHHSPIDDCIHQQVMTLIDAVLGDAEIGTYFLFERPRDGGSVQEADGRVWPLKTVDDLRAYVNRPASAAGKDVGDG